jgi:adenylosuccinate lyase
VYPDRMKANMDRSYGLFNSQRVLLALTEKGLSREEAYLVVQKNAMDSWGRGVGFKELLLSDSDVTRYLSSSEIEKIFEIDYYFRNIDYIFERVFG